ncbi:MAG TPA: hypothetical protein VFH08_16280 [Chitinophagaceae bacterium]|nr:hypothetical protein [Chitinophagaceae bacterium]
MKNLKTFLLLFFFPLFGFAQSLNGVYTGVLSNDSTTVRRDQSFEMALTEYNGKVYGYAYSTFIVNDTLYYIVKRVKGKVEGDICEVEDDEVIAHNFPQKPEKKVFVTYTLRRNILDSAWKLDGNWKTNLTKKYYAISGKVETKEEKDLSKSKLYEHLGDLDLQKTLAFNKPKEKAPEQKPLKAKEEKNTVAKSNIKKEENNNISSAATKTIEKKPDAAIAKTDTKARDNKPAIETVDNQPKQVEKKEIAVSNSTEKKPETRIAKTDTKLPENKTASVPVNDLPGQPGKKDLVVTNSNGVDKKPENTMAKAETKFANNKTGSGPVNNPPIQIEKTAPAATNTADKKINTPIVKTEAKLPENKTVSVPVANQVPQNTKNATVTNSNQSDKKSDASIVKTENKPVDSKTAATNNQSTQNEKKDVAASDKNASGEFEFQELKRNRKLKPAASLVDGRITISSETIYFKSDSLSIALYDNGEVDGDTVSVIINDEMFIEKQGLKSSAFRKTFYVPQQDNDSLLVVLYAENLGKYPPNTGLLQVKDGEEIFYVRFKADLDRNAAIVLRRKYK